MPTPITSPSAQEAIDWQKWVQTFLQIGGAFAVGWFAHLLTSRREKASGKSKRRKQYLAFMRGWRVDFDRKYLEVGGFARRSNSFVDALPEFVSLSEELRHDFNGVARKEFESLVDAVASCGHADFNNTTRYAELLRKIDGLIAYIEKATE